MMHESEKQKLLRKLQAARFAVHDASLYLDSHPTCQDEEAYGPLTASASCAEEYWDWVCTAFPWERGES